MQGLGFGWFPVFTLVLATGCADGPPRGRTPIEMTPIRDDSAVAPTTLTFTPSAEGPLKGTSVELRADGTIVVGGKDYAKLSGDKVTDKNGTAIVTVLPDGTLIGASGPLGAKFVGDELVGDDGKRTSVDADGNVKIVQKQQTQTLGKFSGARTSKRSTILVTQTALTYRGGSEGPSHVSPPPPSHGGGGGKKPPTRKRGK